MALVCHWESRMYFLKLRKLELKMCMKSYCKIGNKNKIKTYLPEDVSDFEGGVTIETLKHGEKVSF